eukprot:UN09143
MEEVEKTEVNESFTKGEESQEEYFLEEEEVSMGFVPVNESTKRVNNETFHKNHHENHINKQIGMYRGPTHIINTQTNVYSTRGRRLNNKKQSLMNLP